MLKTYPALDVRTDSSDLLLARADDFAPSAVEERDAGVRVFFSTAADRDAAQRALAADFDLAPVDVSDEDWAIRSQADLTPVVVGRVTIVSSPQFPSPPFPSPEYPVPSPLTIVIQ